MKKCKTCRDKGFTFDRRCDNKKCDHIKTDWECPKRPCNCKAGAPFRLELRNRIKAQYEFIASLHED